MKNSLFGETSLGDLTSGEAFEIDDAIPAGGEVTDEGTETKETNIESETTPSNKSEKSEIALNEEDDFSGLIEINDTPKEGNENKNTDDTQVGEDANNSATETDSPSPLLPYAQLLKDKGILPDFDVEQWDGSEEGLLDAVDQEIEAGIQEYRQALDPRVQYLIENLEAGVPFEKVLQMDSNVIRYNSIDEAKVVSDENLQKQILSDFYKRTTKLNDDKINRLIENFETIGNMEDEAKSALADLKKLDIEEVEAQKQQSLQQKEQAKVQQEKVLKDLGTKISETKEIVPGIPLNKTSRNKLFDSMVKPVAIDAQGRPVNRVMQVRNEDPMHFEMALHYLVEVTNGFKDWSKIQVPGKKKVVSDLEKISAGLKTNSSGSSRKRLKVDKEDTKPSNDILESIRKTFG